MERGAGEIASCRPPTHDTESEAQQGTHMFQVRGWCRVLHPTAVNGAGGLQVVLVESKQQARDHRRHNRLHHVHDRHTALRGRGVARRRRTAGLRTCARLYARTHTQRHHRVEDKLN